MRAAVLSLLAGLALAGPAWADGPRHGPPGHDGGPHGHHRGPRLAPVPPPYALDPYPSTYRPLPRVDTVILHATVLDGAGRRFEDAGVLLREGKVVAIGPGLTAPAGVAATPGGAG